MPKPSDGPGTKPVDEYYRDMHLPLDREQRSIMERVLQDTQIHRNNMGQIERIGAPITPPFRHGQ